MKKNKTPQEKYRFKKTSTHYFGYFFKVMLIAFIPVFIVCVLLSVVGAPTWVQWIVPLVCLSIAGVIGLSIQMKIEKAEKEENKKMQRNKKGKIVPKRDDVDIFGE